jgi:2-methylaconitate cis-trans-isomerase PrpF
MSGVELPLEVDSNADLIRVLHEIRGRAVVAMAHFTDWREAERLSHALPLVVLVASSEDYRSSEGDLIQAVDIDLRARLVFYNRCHECMVGNGAMCLASMARVPHTLVHGVQAIRPSDGVRIGHSLGVMKVEARASFDATGAISFSTLGFGRTARRLFSDKAWVRAGD